MARPALRALCFPALLVLLVATPPSHARQARGEVGDSDFQDQVRAPAARGLPDEGRRRNDVGAAAAAAAARGLQADGSAGAASHAASSHFAPLPEDKASPLASGDLRPPFVFTGEGEMHSRIDAAYDRVMDSAGLTAAAAAAAAGGGGGSEAEVVLNSEHMRE
jgi:hypothetical protein